MNLEILCTTKLTKKEDAWLEQYAAKTGTTKEEAIRCAVLYYATQCVPTHGAAAR